MSFYNGFPCCILIFIISSCWKYTSTFAEYVSENPRTITKCEHHFHLACILEWMERSDICPICDQVCFLSPLFLYLYVYFFFHYLTVDKELISLLVNLNLDFLVLDLIQCPFLYGSISIFTKYRTHSLAGNDIWWKILNCKLGGGGGGVDEIWNVERLLQFTSMLKKSQNVVE